MSELVRNALKTVSLKQAIQSTGQEEMYMGPKELDAFQKDELIRWGKIIKAAGIEPE